jgi:hypothetical protein
LTPGPIRHAFALLGACLLMAALAPPPLPAAEEKDGEESSAGTDCRMTFNLKGWSVFYRTARGEGIIRCESGQTARVTIKVTGGGITFGKSEIKGATGRFSEVESIGELYGSYVQSEAHAGVGRSASAQALTKGTVSLAIAGTGKGIDIGFAFGKFTIKPAG